jgi:hypothetical protein
MGRLIVLLAWMMLIAPSAVAQIPCPGAVISGCSSPYYNAITSASLGINLGAFTTPVTYPPAISTSKVGVVLGSTGTPDNTATPAGYFEKIGTGNPALAGNDAFTAVAVMVGPAAQTGSPPTFSHMTALYGLAESRQTDVAGVIPYLEGLRSEAIINGTSPVAAYGLVSAAGTNSAFPYTYLIGAEMTVSNNYDSPSLTFNPYHFAAALSLVCGYPGASPHDCDAAIIGSPFASLAAHFFRGVYFPSGSLDAAGILIQADGPLGLGLNLQFASGMSAWAVVPNNTPLWQLNAAGNAIFDILKTTSANVLTVGPDTGLVAVQIASASVPTTIEGSMVADGTVYLTGLPTTCSGKPGTSVAAIGWVSGSSPGVITLCQ